MTITFKSDSQRNFSSDYRSGPVNQRGLTVFRGSANRLFVFSRSALSFCINPGLSLRPLRFLSRDFRGYSNFVYSERRPAIVLFLRNSTTFSRGNRSIVLARLNGTTIRRFSISKGIPSSFFFKAIINSITTSPTYRRWFFSRAKILFRRHRFHSHFNDHTDYRRATQATASGGSTYFRIVCFLHSFTTLALSRVYPARGNFFSKEIAGGSTFLRWVFGSNSCAMSVPGSGPFFLLPEVSVLFLYPGRCGRCEIIF